MEKFDFENFLKNIFLEKIFFENFQNQISPRKNNIFRSSFFLLTRYGSPLSISDSYEHPGGFLAEIPR